MGLCLLAAFAHAAEVERPPNCRADQEEGFSLALLAGDRLKAANVSRCFGTGKASGGSPCQVHAAPSSWAVEFYESHLDEKVYDTTDAYRDIEFGGADTAPAKGIETASAAFYAGHGSPGGWAARDGRTWLDDLRLGNGPLRYLLACSCNIMAHGPRVSPSQGPADYRRPDRFGFDHDGTDADLPWMRNVFYRWRNAMGPNFRMACGGSSVICASDGPDATEGFWNLYTDECAGPADAFTGGLGSRAAGSSGTSAIPLCIAQGGKEPIDSPLFDAVFSSASNEHGDDYLHIQYPVAGPEWPSSLAADGTDSFEAKLREALLGPASVRLPILELADGFDLSDAAVDRLRFLGADASTIRESEHHWYGESNDGRYWIHKTSGAWSLRSKRTVSPLPLQGLEGFEVAVDDVLGASARTLTAGFLASSDIGGSEVVPEAFGATGPVRAIQYRIDSTPAAFREREVPFFSVRHYLKQVEIVARREFGLETLCEVAPDETSCSLARQAGIASIPVLGHGGRLSLVLAPETVAGGGASSQSVLAASLIARTIGTGSRWVPVVRLADAQQSARERLGEHAAHYVAEPIWWRLAYLEEGASCRQRRLRLYYWFEFVAEPGHTAEEYPPVVVRVPGQVGPYPPDPCNEPD